MQRVNDWCATHGMPRTITENGQTKAIVDVVNGRPLLQRDHNANAASTSGAIHLLPGGISGWGLTGAGLTIGMWEGQSVATQHVEFAASGGGSRVQIMDGSSPSSHGSHVAGTLIASGVNPSARGMAPAASIRSYNWDYELSEMAAEAANGMLISNHSYAYVAGWEPYGGANYWFGWNYLSPTEDYLFGFYYSQTRAWDLIAEAAPYYLVVKAAGNDRGEDLNGPHYFWDGSAYSLSTAIRDADGGTDGYDSMLPRGTAKNILTVGAVNDVVNYTGPSDVTLYSGSCWGPTDDGRIKPDLVANGVGLFSCSNSASGYANLTGTSMATPNAAGSLLLVQEHAMGVRGAYLRAATLKGLAIHTAREAGAAPGPDYQHGWGLIDVYRAATTLDSASIGTALVEEGVLHPSDTNNYWIEVPVGSTEPLTVTLCWTDPVGAPADYVLNHPTSRLVHDLDVRVYSPAGTEVLPWILDPANPGTPATSGDNHRDNVEKIELMNPTAGMYRIEVRHKNVLFAQQPYSLIVTGGNPMPRAGFYVESIGACGADTVALIPHAMLPMPSSTEWLIEPATGWSFIGGTSATSDTAMVVFSAVGAYDVSRIATANLSGGGVYSDTLTHVGAVSVGGSPLPYETEFTILAERELWTTGSTSGGGASGGWYFDTEYGARLRVDNYNSTAADGAVAIGPSLNLTGLGTAELSFVYSYFLQPGAASDTLEVGVVQGCGGFDTALAVFQGVVGSWALDTSSLPFVPYGDGAWCDSMGAGVCATVDLSAFAGQSDVRVYFKNRSAGNNHLHIDGIKITGVPALVGGLSRVAVSCAGGMNGSAQVVVQGGLSPYSYAWSNGGTTGSITGLGAGVYSVSVSDGSGQIWVDSISVSEPLPLVAVEGVVAPSFWGLSDGSVWVQMSGGTPPYDFYWLNGMTADSLFGLAAGVYTYTVIDSLNCTVGGSITLQNPAPPALLGVDSVSNVSCFGGSDGSIDVTVVGGVGPFVISWSNGVTSLGQSGLSAGPYGYSLTDAASQIYTQTLTVSEPDTLEAMVLGGLGWGYLAATGSGGTPPYEVVWSPGGSTSDTLVPTVGGLYTAVLTDAEGCVAAASMDYPLVLPEKRQNGWSLHPNPGRNGVAVLSDHTIQSIRVLDLLGREVAMFEGEATERSRTLDASRWRNGVYLIHVQVNDAWSVGRWIKQ